MGSLEPLSRRSSGLYAGRTLRPRVCALAVSASLLATGAAFAQAPAPSGPSAEVQRAYNGLKANLLKAATETPDAAYSFRPTPDVRTFARVVNHVTEAQGHSCGAVLGIAPTALPPVPPETAPKSAIVDALQASFSTCDKAFATLTDTNGLDMLPAGKGSRSRLGLLWGTVSHDNEQYATLALYMRLKGLVPPSSEK